jgi:hypothetical protein
VAAEATAPPKLGEPGECGSAADFFSGWLNSSRVGHGARAIGDGPAVAVKATAPQNLGVPGECGSAANFFACQLNSGCVGDLGAWKVNGYHTLIN